MIRNNKPPHRHAVQLEDTQLKRSTNQYYQAIRITYMEHIHQQKQIIQMVEPKQNTRKYIHDQRCTTTNIDETHPTMHQHMHP